MSCLAITFTTQQINSKRRVAAQDRTWKRKSFVTAGKTWLIIMKGNAGHSQV
jgi:hypothetical protein